MRRAADLLDAARWPIVLGCTFAGVYLITSLGLALLSIAGLFFLDLLADLLLTGGTSDGRTRRP